MALFGVIRDNDGDKAGGGGIGSPQQIFCRAEGYNIAILGEYVAGHGDHDPNQMIECSNIVKIGGIGICFAGNHAQCGDVAAPGSSIVRTV
jgi:uncharacterized Zn-binding protein involved in type VI secretion